MNVSTSSFHVKTAVNAYTCFYNAMALPIVEMVATKATANQVNYTFLCYYIVCFFVSLLYDMLLSKIGVL